MSQLEYPASELKKRQALEILLNDWQAHFETLPYETFGIDYDGIVRDGFYPHYFSQKTKILYVGREALDLDGCPYLEVLAECYKTKKEVGGTPLNRSFFHARMLHISHGIMNGRIDWDDIPWATKIGDTFATAQGVSFAFMNLSKLSNESGRWNANWRLINAAYAASVSPRNFVKEQVELLEPDLIISMNIANELRAALGAFEVFHSDGEAEGCVVNVGGRRTLLINTWHFSAIKKHVKCFYSPICDILSRWESKLE